MAKVKWNLGKVKWFDNVKGDGVVIDENNKRYYVHYSSIENQSNWKSLKKGQKVKFTAIEKSISNQVDRLKEA